VSDFAVEFPAGENAGSKLDKARELGGKVICAHKGLPLLEFDRAHNGPEDIVAVAAQYPDMDFIVYHALSGAEGGVVKTRGFH
jgi:hypothetical protein